MAFKTFISQRQVRRTQAGAFIRMCKRDQNLPDAETWEELSAYLRSKSASAEVMNRARRVWLDYKLWASQIFDRAMNGEFEPSDLGENVPIEDHDDVDFDDRSNYDHHSETERGVTMDLKTFIHTRNKTKTAKGEIVEYLKGQTDPGLALAALCEGEVQEFEHPSFVKAAKRLRWEFHQALAKGLQPRKPLPEGLKGDNDDPAPCSVEESGLAVFYDRLLDVA